MHNHIPPPHLYKGSSGDDHMALAHFNKPELDALDKIQGGSERVNGVRIYSRLGTMLEHPDAKHHIRAMHHEHLASGGHAVHEQLKHMAHNGRFGDSEMAYVPKHVLHTFDHSIGGPSINPRDGKHEYFLGTMLSAISRFARPAISAVSNLFKPAAQSAASSASKINQMFPKPGIGAASGYAPNASTVSRLNAQLPKMGASV
jgi:hypothetical protein